MPDHLTPCPFCGQSKLDVQQRRLDDIGFCGSAKVWSVYCYPCQVRGTAHADRAKAIAAWNTRPS